MHGVTKETYWSVVDQCYLCDLCYMTKCPYTPPHVWNLDFPHLMLRAKAIKYKKGQVKAGDKFLASTDMHGQFAGIPVVVQVVNAINRTKTARKLMDSALGVHPDAWMPELASQRFRWGAAKSAATVVTNGERTPGKVAVFSTCFINYNEPGIGHDLLKVLAHNDIPYVDRREGEVLRHAQARARRPRRGGRAQGGQHSGAGEARARGVCHRHRGAELHADVQAGTAADVPRLRRHAGS